MNDNRHLDSRGPDETLEGAWSQRVGVNGRIPEAAAARRDELKSKIEAALERRTNGDAERICVAVEGDTVVLSGRVRSWAVREAARAAAWAVIGVGSVADRLIISY